MSTYTPDQRIKPYLDHLASEGPGVSWITDSTKTLMRAYEEHGAATIEVLLRIHWDTMRVIQEHR